MTVSIFKNFNVAEISSESSLTTPFGYTPKLANLITQAIFMCCVSSLHINVEDDISTPQMTDDRLNEIAYQVFELAALGYAHVNSDNDEPIAIDPLENTLSDWAFVGRELSQGGGPNDAQILIVSALWTLDNAMENAKVGGASLASLEALASAAFSLLNAGRAVTPDPDSVKEIEQSAISTHAKRGADATHVENRKMKEDIFRWCDENMHKFPSMERAAQAAAGTIVPVMPRTVRTWIGLWNKAKQSAGRL